MIFKILQLVGRVEFIPFSWRYRLARYFRNPENSDPAPFETDFYGLKYRGDLKSYVDWNVYFFGAYEKPLLYFMRKIAAQIPNPVFVDIGANVGHHSLFMSRYCDRVISFEPFGALVKKFRGQIERNQVANIELIECGLGDEEAMLEYYAPIGANEGVGTFTDRAWANTAKLPERLKVVRGDDLFQEKAPAKIDLMKIDVEGFEKNVLTGLRESLRRYRPVIIMEYEEDTYKKFSGEEELKALFPEGYEARKFNYKNAREVYLTPFDFHHYGGDTVWFPTEKQSLLQKALQ